MSKSLNISMVLENTILLNYDEVNLNIKFPTKNSTVLRKNTRGCIRVGVGSVAS